MTRIFRIGKSFGVKIPKGIFQQAGFKENIDLIFKITDDGLLISPEKQARDGWEQKFKSFNKSLTEFDVLREFSNDFDKDQWNW